MKTRLVEASQGTMNWGKFLLGRLDTEWDHKSALPGGNFGKPLLASRMRNPNAILVLDLETLEGAMFVPGGSASYDLNKHEVWVCPMYEPFLNWLYDYVRQYPTVDEAFDAVPPYVEIPDAPFALAGYRRKGRE